MGIVPTPATILPLNADDVDKAQFRAWLDAVQTALGDFGPCVLASLAANDVLVWTGAQWGNAILGNILFPQSSTPAQITADQNNYANASVVMRLSTDAARNLTGLAGGTGGMVRVLHNVGTFNLVLKKQDTGSIAANRFAISADLTLAPDQSAILVYDGASSRWRLLGAASGSGGGASALSALSDVSISGLTAGQGLRYNGAAWVNAAAREVLTANRTYYVRTDGSDSNNGLANTSGGAFLTLQKAYDVAAGLDLSIYDVVIQVGNGTYTAGVSCNKPFVGKGNVTFRGDTATPSNVFINPTAGDCFYAENGASIRVEGFKVAGNTSAARCLNAFNLAVIVITGNMEFAASAAGSIHVQAVRGAIVTSQSSYTISGGATNHWGAGTGGSINANGAYTYTLTGTPAFTTFANASRVASISCHGVTFSGSATGTRYNAEGNGVIFTAGGGASFIPGNAAGTTATGGQYI